LIRQWNNSCRKPFSLNESHYYLKIFFLKKNRISLVKASVPPIIVDITLHSFKTRLSLTGQSGIWPIQSWNQVGLKKKHEKEKPGVAQLIRQDPVKNPVATHRLLFFYY
jgi:hypothetical protein